MSIKIVFRLACIATLGALVSGCLPGSGGDIVPALKQLPAGMQVLLAKQGMTQEAPIFVRIFKEESQLEVWKQKRDGRFHLLKTYPICTWSGALGPKVKEGDKQAPEGFYTVTPGQMNPNSQFHLSFNLGYPNAYDKVNGRTGGALMVHGDCRSAGCFAMTVILDRNGASGQSLHGEYSAPKDLTGSARHRFPEHAFSCPKTNFRHKKTRPGRVFSVLRGQSIT